MIASKSDSSVIYYYQDHLGSDINSRSLPFGQEIVSGERFSFTGKELDNELYYFGARYYNSNLGKFISIDPVKDNHAYSYVANNPLMFVDPDGKDPKKKWLLIGNSWANAYLANNLKEKGFNIDYRGYSGSSSGKIVDHFVEGGGGQSSAPVYDVQTFNFEDYDSVLFIVSLNDQAIYNFDPERTITNLRKLISETDSREMQTFIMTVPPALEHFSSKGKGEESLNYLNVVNSWILENPEELNYQGIDIYTDLNDNGELKYVDKSGFHLKIREGYEYLANVIKNALE